MAVGHRDLDTFLVCFDGLFAIAGQGIGIGEYTVGVAFVISFGELVFE